MIIDTHAHIGNMLNFNLTEEDLLYSMQRYGIDYSLVSNLEAVEFGHHGEPVPKHLQKSQKTLLERTLHFARRNEDKIGVFPWLKIAGEKIDEDFDRIVGENRDIIYALKLHPFHSRTSPDSEKAEQVYRLAAKYALPVVSHTGGCEEADSIHVFQAAKAHPEINFVMVHMDLGTDNKKAVDLLGKLPNLYGDTTWVPVSTTLEVIRRWGSEKIVFGTDNTIDGPDTLLHNKEGKRSLYQEYFHELKEMLPKKDYENVMYKNAVRLLGLEKRFPDIEKEI